MPRLNQTLALEKGIKARALAVLSAAHHTVQKLPLLSGLSRTYQPIEDGGEILPPESTRVQVKTEVVLKEISAALTDLFDVVATKDATNCVATASVVVDGAVLLPDVPVTYLLFLEKQLVDLHTFVSKLPRLDPAENWNYREDIDCWATEPVVTLRGKKVMRNHVLAEATDKHPAQVQVYSEDIPVGRWTTIKFSGALPASRVTELLARVDALQRAVKIAREEANSITTVDRRVGAEVFGYLFR